MIEIEVEIDKVRPSRAGLGTAWVGVKGLSTVLGQLVMFRIVARRETKSSISLINLFRIFSSIVVVREPGERLPLCFACRGQQAYADKTR
jgi:hypothetical protein